MLGDGSLRYNYDHFTQSAGIGRTRDFMNQLRAGDEAPDFELPALDGERVRLSDFRGRRHVLLEFGSIT